MKRLLLAVLAVMCCVTEETLKMDVKWAELPIYWSRSSTMDPVQILLVEEGFDYWNKALGKEVFVEVLPDDYLNPHFPAQVTIYPAGENFPSPIDSKFYTRVATTSDDRHTVVLWSEFDELNLNEQRTAIRHEAGHVLGMSHSTDDKCLMYFSVGNASSAPREACAKEITMLKAYYEF